MRLRADIPELARQSNTRIHTTLMMCLLLLAAPHASLGATKDVVLAVAKAKEYINTPYDWGGESKGGIDCSGLVREAFKAADIRLPRQARHQALYGKPVKPEDLMIGDLLFFKIKKSYVDHVGMVIEADGIGPRFIHASFSSGKVVIDYLEPWKGDIYSIKRIIEQVPGDFPQASTRRLTTEDLNSLSAWELRIMRNEIFARYGYVFHVNPSVIQHFASQKWYVDTPKLPLSAKVPLSKIELDNVQIIKEWEQGR